MLFFFFDNLNTRTRKERIRAAVPKKSNKTKLQSIFNLMSFVCVVVSNDGRSKIDNGNAAAVAVGVVTK